MVKCETTSNLPPFFFGLGFSNYINLYLAKTEITQFHACHWYMAVDQYILEAAGREK